MNHTTHLEAGQRRAPVESVINYGDLDDDAKKLILAAILVRTRAYAPYSNFKVGAAFRTKCGRIFTGCNVESVSYSPTSCAERTAISKAVSEGYTKFIAGAVVAFQPDAFTAPCGVCRQFIMEFASEDIPLYITKSEDNKPKLDSDEVLHTSIHTLLPFGFRSYN